MPISASNPITKPAQSEKTYDTLFLSDFHVQAADPNANVRVVAVLDKLHHNGSSYEKAPLSVDGSHGIMVIDDLYAKAASDSNTITLDSTLGGAGPAVTLSLADIITALLEKTKQIAEADGVI